MISLLLVHNYYQQRGGEYHSFTAESALLEQRGHRVVRYTAHNDRVRDMSRPALARATLWNHEAYRDVRTLIRQHRPDVVHVHNTFPLISPSVYYAARAEGVPVVQTLRNYRLYCLNSYFFRDGHVCEDCLGKTVPWPGVAHKCYRDDRLASTAVSALLSSHRLLGTWTRTVDLYVVLTEFARRKFIQAGLSADKLFLKPNFLPWTPAVGEGKGGFALFVGRLSAEKGVHTLLNAWRGVGEALPLKIVGDGPLAPAVASAAAQMAGVEWLGARSIEEVYALMGAARLLIFPSELYETFGRVAMEAFATGTPVIASNIGAIAELVEDGSTGLHFRPGDVRDLAARVHWALAHPDTLTQMRHHARAAFEARYTAERNYEMCMEIYGRVLGAPSHRRMAAGLPPIPAGEPSRD